MSKYEAIHNPVMQTSFALEGRFLDYAADDRGKLKYIRLANTSEHPIKLSKHLRSQRLIPGEWIQVTGTRQVNPVTGQVKLKAKDLTIVRPLSLAPISLALTDASPMAASKSSKPETILVCQKSDCCKLGAKAIATALQTAIQEQGLTNQVIVKGTGCMKRCKAGPNLVMPDKTRYTKISPKAIPALIEQHFAPTVPGSVPATKLVPVSQPAAITSPSPVAERVAS
ncbi:MAG: (2Fe-2S) ferredoxin domain-containing protein [Timaviella obliquedivisa GSE-PSE-MK23-08B]|nr:(2Fe-2S) ferredoxin domain-containing protein [Timaviella obliquedivisa GSE-PSE-MK23-08B]